jgi:hypothetical protein
VWARGPEHKVFIDGRGELYEHGGVFADYMHITLLKPGALSVLRGYDVQSCLVLTEEPFATVLAALPEWPKVYSDKVSTLFVRRNVALYAETPPTLAMTASNDWLPQPGFGHTAIASLPKWEWSRHRL